MSILLLILSGSGPPARAGADAWSVVSSPSPGEASLLRGVSAYDASHVWAVGEYLPTSSPYKTLIVSYNGSSWSQDTSPNPAGTGDNSLYGVSANTGSSGDVWAVGDHTLPSSSVGSTLIERWNGSSWSIVSSPNPGGTLGEDHLRAVSTLDSTHAWAVGYYTGSGGYNSMILSWDGSSWTQDTSQNPDASYNVLFGVAAGADDDVWAVGYKGSPSSSALLTEHWNGTSWSAVAAPLPRSTISAQFRSVTYITSDNVWAVGYYTDSTGRKTLAENWDGSSWTIYSTPNPDTTDQFNGVAGLESDFVWGVGHSAAGDSTLTEVYNGSSWSTVSSPDVGSAANVLNAVVVVPGAARCVGGDLWTVGGEHDTNASFQTLIEQYSITSCSGP